MPYAILYIPHDVPGERKLITLNMNNWLREPKDYDYYDAARNRCRKINRRAGRVVCVVGEIEQEVDQEDTLDTLRKSYDDDLQL